MADTRRMRIDILGDSDEDDPILSVVNIIDGEVREEASA